MSGKGNDAQRRLADRHYHNHHRVLDSGIPLEKRLPIHWALREWFEHGWQWLATPPCPTGRHHHTNNGGKAMTENLPAPVSEAATPAAEDVKVTVEKRVKQYIAVRDALKKMDEDHDTRRKPLVNLQNELTGWLQNFMEQAGAENVKTSEGTCYLSTRYSTSLADPEAFMKHVRATESFDLLDRKANVTAVKDYVSEHGSLPPGVNLSAIQTVGVRRASGK